MDMSFGAFYGIFASLFVLIGSLLWYLWNKKLLPEGAEYLIILYVLSITLSLHSFFSSWVFYANTQKAISDFQQKLSNIENSN
jgi:zinc transporter ZupT